MATTGPVRPIHHLGYLVPDLAEAARSWHDIAGIGPFLALEHVPFDEIEVDGVPSVFDHSAAFAAYGPMFVELQVIHGLTPAAGRARLEPGGPAGLNHVAYACPDLAAESDRLTASGLPCVLGARSGGLRIAWHDAARTLGIAVELHQDGEFLETFFAAVTEAARGWDGQDVLQVITG